MASTILTSNSDRIDVRNGRETISGKFEVFYNGELIDTVDTEDECRAVVRELKRTSNNRREDE